MSYGDDEDVKRARTLAHAMVHAQANPCIALHVLAESYAQHQMPVPGMNAEQLLCMVAASATSLNDWPRDKVLEVIGIFLDDCAIARENVETAREARLS